MTALAWGLAWMSRNSVFWKVTLLGTLALTLAAPGPVAGMALDSLTAGFPAFTTRQRS